MAELKAMLRAMRLAESTKLAELKAMRDEAARKFDFTKAHTGPNGNDWITFARANAEWEQFYRKVYGGCEPESDTVDRAATLWSRKYQKH